MVIAPEIEFAVLVACNCGWLGIAATERFAGTSPGTGPRLESDWANGLDGLDRVLEDPEARQLHFGLWYPAPPEKDPIHEHHVRGLE